MWKFDTAARKSTSIADAAMLRGSLRPPLRERRGSFLDSLWERR